VSQDDARKDDTLPPAAVAASARDARDRRDTDRVPYASRVMIVRGNAAWFAQLLDLSTGGCGVFRPTDCDLAEDELVRLFFHHDDGAVSVNIPARIARMDGDRVGIEYHEPQSIPPARAR
jgi:hypothetical protein